MNETWRKAYQIQTERIGELLSMKGHIHYTGPCWRQIINRVRYNVKLFFKR